jgi:hypothetical protein
MVRPPPVMVPASQSSALPTRSVPLPLITALLLTICRFGTVTSAPLETVRIALRASLPRPVTVAPLLKV